MTGGMSGGMTGGMTGGGMATGGMTGGMTGYSTGYQTTGMATTGMQTTGMQYSMGQSYGTGMTGMATGASGLVVRNDTQDLDGDGVTTANEAARFASGERRVDLVGGGMGMGMGQGMSG